MTDYYIVSLKHTRDRDNYVSFWRENNQGYAWPLSWAGRYSEEEVSKHVYHYNDGVENVAVPCDSLDHLLGDPLPHTIDNNAGPVVRNNKENIKAILAIAMRTTAAREAANPPVSDDGDERYSRAIQQVAKAMQAENIGPRKLMWLWQERHELLFDKQYPALARTRIPDESNEPDLSGPAPR